jgi:DNA repair photolyase
MLNESKGNMYDFVTHTWNTIKGECPHGCTYCYMHRWGKQKPIRFDEKELKTNLGVNNFIFVGSSCDMWAEEIQVEWIMDTLLHCKKYMNRYLFQTKNPSRINQDTLPVFSIVCTTIETNRWYEWIMGNSPPPYKRALGMYCIDLPKYVTVEPILDFDLGEMIEIMQSIKPQQINIGSNSGNNYLPEPPKEKILELISELEKFTIVKQKSNLKRLLK